MSEDRIQVKGMQFFGHHGITEEEQSVGQRIEVDVEIEVDFLLQKNLEPRKNGRKLLLLILLLLL